MLKTLIIVTILSLGSVTVFAQKVKPRHKPKPKIRVVKPTPDFHTCGEYPNILNDRAISLPEPVYSEAARAAHAEGVVNVQILIDEAGNVTAASAASGHVLLRAAAVAAARRAKFSETRLSGRPVKVQGILTYDFNAFRKAKNLTTGPGKAGRNKKVPRVISGGVMNGKANYLPRPTYPLAAVAVRAEGVVGVSVLIDEEGKVISATAVSGSHLLRGAAVKVAKEATFEPMSLEGEPIRVAGFITYFFIGDLNWGQTGRFLSQAEAGRGHQEMLKIVAYKLPDEFREEKIEIDSIAFLFDRTYAEPGELNERSKKVIESIQEKLLNDPVNSWHFSFRVTLGRIKGSINDDSNLAMHLLKLKELISSPPEGISGEITREIRTIADHAGRFAFTGAERENILLAVK